MKKLLLLLLSIAILTALPLKALAEDLTMPTVLKAGDLMPVSEITTLNNDKVSTTTIKYPAIVSVFTTWCTVCRKELPLLNNVLSDAQSKKIPLMIMGIDAGEPVRKVASYQRKQNLSFDLFVDPNLDLIKQLQIKGTPVIMVFNKKGKLAYQGHSIPDNWQSLVQ